MKKQVVIHITPDMKFSDIVNAYHQAALDSKGRFGYLKYRLYFTAKSAFHRRSVYENLTELVKALKQ